MLCCASSSVTDFICSIQTMYQATFTPEQGWSGGLEPYAPLQLDPSAQVLNYGQSVFEGMKAQRTPGGNIVLFRPDENAARMMAGVRVCCSALRMCHQAVAPLHL